jgi:hypothetical protein
MLNVKALSPEGNVARDSELTDESLESLAHRSVADDPELQIRDLRQGKRHDPWWGGP